MRKRIIIYLTGLNTSGGKERVVSNLLKEWESKYEIFLIFKNNENSFYTLPEGIERHSLNTPFIKSMYNMSGSRLIRIYSTFMNMLASIVMLRSILRKRGYDYLYVTTPLNAFEAFFAMKNAAKKLVISEHASFNAYNKVYSWMKRKIYPRAHCVSVPNKMDTEEYKRWGCNTIFIPHLVTFKNEDKNSLDGKIVINIGRLTPDKQQEKLISIWANIKNKTGWQLWIVGDGEEKSNLERKIKELHVSESVKLLPATKQIKSIYRQASVFALSSRCEGFGMVLLEAMSFGIPCISFDCPSGPRDVIRNGENGFLIENNNVECYIKTLETIMEMSLVDLSILGDNAYRTVVNWDNEEILKKWSDVFV